MKASHIIIFYVLQILKKYLSSLNARKRYALSAKFGSILYHFLDLRKDQARKNIKRAFPKLESYKIEKILKKTYLNFFHNFVELTSFPKSWEKIKIEINFHIYLQSLIVNKKTIKTGNINSAADKPSQVILRAFPLVFSKYLDTVVDAVCDIRPWPLNLRKKIPINKKAIVSIVEKK